MEYLSQLQDSVPLSQLLISAGVIVGGTLIGLLFERFALKGLYKAVYRTRWNGDDIIINALRHMVTIWFALLSIYIVVLRRDIDKALAGFLKIALAVALTITIGMVVARIASGFVKLYFSSV